MNYKDKMMFLCSYISPMENNVNEKRKMSRKTQSHKPLIYKAFRHIFKKILIFLNV